jgi:hypothetical protein
MQKTLIKWTVATHPDDAYAAPEVAGNPGLGGIDQRGKRVITSRIQSFRGRFVTTASGSVYQLIGEPDEHFLKFLKDKRLKFNDREPLAPLVRARFIYL